MRRKSLPPKRDSRQHYEEREVWVNLLRFQSATMKRMMMKTKTKLKITVKVRRHMR
jgi:hypothetical protein